MQKRRHNPRGFFIIWGSRNRITGDGRGHFDATCPACNQSVRIEGKIARTWFTLYFIPIFPTGAGTRFTQCSTCKTQFRGTFEEMKTALERNLITAPDGTRSQRPPVASAGFQQAIALFNQLRETPADSAKLARLLRMYLDMNEPSEAISAGKTYHDAAESSDACMTLMAQAYLDTGDRDKALLWSTAALALNPQNPDAPSLKALASMPPTAAAHR